MEQQRLGFVDQDGALLIRMRNVRTNEVQELQKIEWLDRKWLHCILKMQL